MLGKNRHVARIIVIVCIAAVTAVAGIAQADDGGWGGGHCGKEQRGGFKKMEKKLGLTEAQKAQAKAIFEGNRDAMKPIHTALQTERKTLQTLMRADTIDEAAIRAETAKIAGIQADLNVNRAKVGAQFRAILTPAQQAILKTVDHKRHKKGEAIIDPAE
jgi:Spy/CpxP family protein refolding chaperone